MYPLLCETDKLLAAFEKHANPDVAAHPYMQGLQSCQKALSADNHHNGDSDQQDNMLCFLTPSNKVDKRIFDYLTLQEELTDYSFESMVEAAMNKMHTSAVASQYRMEALMVSLGDAIVMQLPVVLCLATAKFSVCTGNKNQPEMVLRHFDCKGAGVQTVNRIIYHYKTGEQRDAALSSLSRIAERYATLTLSLRNPISQKCFPRLSETAPLIIFTPAAVVYLMQNVAAKPVLARDFFAASASHHQIDPTAAAMTALLQNLRVEDEIVASWEAHEQCRYRIDRIELLSKYVTERIGYSPTCIDPSWRTLRHCGRWYWSQKHAFHLKVALEIIRKDLPWRCRSYNSSD